MNWKVGDKFWVDYDKMSKLGYYMQDWKRFFPPHKSPFIVNTADRNYVSIKSGMSINKDYIYVAKNQIVKQIIKDLL